MPQMNFDLEDGQDPVSLSLSPGDAERFQAFIAECNGYLKRAERLEKLLAAERGSADAMRAALVPFARAWARREPEVREGGRPYRLRMERALQPFYTNGNADESGSLTGAHLRDACIVLEGDCETVFAQRDARVALETLDNLIDSLIEVGGTITVAGIQGYRDEIVATEGTDG